MENYITRIMITFDQTVSITESFYPALSISELFSDMGGSIGLMDYGLVLDFSIFVFMLWILSISLKEKFLKDR